MKDNYLMNFAGETLKDVDFENVVIGQLMRMDVDEDQVKLVYLADENRVDQRLSIKRDRHGLTEFLGIEQRSFGRVNVVEVELERHRVRGG